MIYSFIDIPEKTPFSGGVKRVWTVLAGALFLMLAAIYLLRAANNDRIQAYQSLLQEEEALALQIGQLETQQKAALKKRVLYERIQLAGQLSIEKARNIMDLVPDDTTLQRFELYDDALVLAGYTADSDQLQQRFVIALSEFYHLEERRIAPEMNGKRGFMLHFVTRETGQ